MNWLKIDKSMFFNMVFMTAFILSILGIIFIGSTESTSHFKNLFYLKQIFSLLISIIVYILFCKFDYQNYSNLVVFIYIGGLLLLLFVLVFGIRINGAKSWVNFGFYNGQLAEFSKIAYILSFAYFIDHYQDDIYNHSFFFYSLLFLAPFIGLLVLQPDFGTAVIFLCIFLVMFFAGGGNPKILIFAIPIFILSVVIPFMCFLAKNYSKEYIWLVFFNFSSVEILCAGIFFLVVASILFIIYYYALNKKIIFIISTISIIISLGLFGGFVFKSCLKEYHYDRMLVTINPSLDPEKKGYNLNQSLISIGGGRLFGYGLSKGPQNRGHFLPASHTDFIFAVVAEEFGFFGVIIIIFLNVFLIYNILKIANQTRDFLGFLIIIGLSGLLISHFLINTLSVIGLLPVIGIPFPFLSYGGSFLLTGFISLGIIYNINSARYKFRKTI